MTVATPFVRSTAHPLPQAGDPELLTTIVWRKSASNGLQRAALDGDLAEFGRRMRAATPFRRAAIWETRARDAERAASPPWWQPLWSRRAFGPSARSTRLAEFLASWKFRDAGESRKLRAGRIDRVAELLDEYDRAAPADPFEQLSWGTLLLYGTFLPDELFARLWCAAYRWRQLPSAMAENGERSAWTVDQRLLAEGELPILLGRVCTEVRGARRTAAGGAEALRVDLQKMTDAEGMPHARLLERLPLWLAPFVRSANTARVLGKPWWDDASRVRFRRLVTQSAALCRSSGQIALSNGARGAPVAMLRTAARLAGLKPRHRSSQFLRSIADDSDLASDATRIRRRDAAHRIGRKRRPLHPTSRKHRPAAQSDWAQLACLRNNWGLGADACVIAFDGRVPRIDLTAFGVPALSGAWQYTTTISGQPAPAVERWECVCWYTDGDADFVEIQGSAAGQLTLLRQALLSRTDHFLLLNDVVKKTTDETPAELTHALRLPFASTISAAADALTREWRIEVGSLPVRVFPLGLPQQTVRGAAGRLQIETSRLELSQRANGNGLSCPLLLDWSPVRRDEPAQWHALTVAENGRTLASCEAAAWRLRIGNHQWVCYHSLRPGETARTVLGLHTFHETVIGEFTAAGVIEPIVLVEGPGSEMHGPR